MVWTKVAPALEGLMLTCTSIGTRNKIFRSKSLTKLFVCFQAIKLIKRLFHTLIAGGLFKETSHGLELIAKVLIYKAFAEKQ